MSYFPLRVRPPVPGVAAARVLAVPLMIAALLSTSCSDDPAEPAHVHVVSTVTLAPTTTTLRMGEEITLNAVARCSEGDLVPTTFSWTTSSTDIATVSSSGVVRAISAGSATISATAENHSGTAAIVVVAVGTVVGPSGGTVVSTDANVELVIPAGALAAPTDVVLQPVDAALFAGDPNYIPGTGYQLMPDNLQLQTRAQLRIRYNPDNIPPGVFPEQLRLQERDRVQNQWRETQQHQLLTQMLQGEIERFGVFAVVVKPAIGTMVGPAGGTVVSTDANVELVIPAGALATPTDVIVQPLDAALFAGDPNYIPGTGYQLMPDGLQLQTRAQLRIRYNPILLPPGVFPEQLRLQERDRVQNQWRETQQHQLLAQKVQGEIDRLGMFAIVVKPATGTMVGTAGATVVSSDGNAVLTIPAGALTTPVDITIQKVDDPFAAMAARLAKAGVNVLAAETDIVIAGTAYEMKPAGQQFQVPVQLRIGYDPSKVPTGIEPQTLRIRERDRQQNRWRDPSQCTAGNNQVSTTINSLGLFAIVATETVLPPPPPPPPTVSEVMVSPAVASVDEGDVIQLTATVLDYDGNVVALPVTWSSSNTAVATVDQTGKVTGVSKGSVTISAKAGGMQGGGSVNVTPRVASVTVTPSTASIVIGGTVRLTAELKDSEGNVVTRTVTWQSSDQNIASVSGGLVTGVATGNAVITAKVQNVSGSANVSVLGSSVNSVVITEIGKEPLEVGLTLQLTATVYSNGVPVNVPVTWMSSDANIATVENPTGLVTAVASGTVTITATAGTASDAVSIKVVGGGETETLGNNLSVPVVFADGVGISGLPVTEDPGVRPLLTEGITIDALPFWYTGNVADYNTYFLQQGTNTWRPEIVDGTGQSAYSASIYWGDNLTVRDWSAARPIRVEQALTAVGMTLKGFNMTYLYGDGPTEMYGTDGTIGDFTPNIYTKDPTLIVEKLESETGRAVAEVVNEIAVSEVNVAGKLIYGYNLRLADWTPPAGVTRDGWYKITFRLATGGNLNITAVGNAEGLRTPTFTTRESSLVIYVTP